MTMISALRMASTLSSSAAGRSGTSRTLRIRELLIFFGVEDLALAEHAAAVVELRLQMHVLIRDWQHAAGDGEDVSHAVYGLVKRAGNAVHGS